SPGGEGRGEGGLTLRTHARDCTGLTLCPSLSAYPGRELPASWHVDIEQRGGDEGNSSLYLRPFDSGASVQPRDMNMIGVHDGVVRWPLQNVRRRPGQIAGLRIARQKNAALRQRDDCILRGGQSALGTKDNAKGPDPKRGADRWKGDDCAQRETG